MERRKGQTLRRLLALMLCFAMLLGAWPVTAGAEETASEPTSDSQASQRQPEESSEPQTEPSEEAEDATGAADPTGDTQETESTEESEAAEESDTPEDSDAAEPSEDAEAEIDTASAEAPITMGAFQIPGYATENGVQSQVLVTDGGNGVAGDGSNSYFVMITGTTAQEFAAYCDELAKTYGQPVFENETAGVGTQKNRFRKFVAGDQSHSVYTYFLEGYGETRILVDTQADTVAGYSYTPQSGITVEPKLAMWGLSMSPTGYDITSQAVGGMGRRNCGALLVIRMPDNSLFIHDGGDIQQWSDEACAEFLAFCRELTGISSGKMVINTWFVSHAHSDHFLGFPRFMLKYHDHFELKNIVYNVDDERRGTTRDIHDIMQTVSGYYDDVKYYKPHTGEVFDIAGVKFDVIYTHEDRLYPNAAGELIIASPYDVGGTYREGMNKNETESDFNDTCTVVRVNFPNGVNALLYADMNLAESILETIYPTSSLKTDIMLIPHHGFNSHPDLVSYADAKVYLYTQHKNAVYGPDNDVTTVDIYATYRTTLRDNYLEMFPEQKVAPGTENVDYSIFWAGNETVTIDINSLAGASGNDSAAYAVTEPALNFMYTGWTVNSLVDSTERNTLLSTENKVTTDPIETATIDDRYERVGLKNYDEEQYVIENGRYVLMNVATGFIMSYESVAWEPGMLNMAGSLRRVDEEPVNTTAKDIYFWGTSGKRVYLDQSNRDRAIWIIKTWADDKAELNSDNVSTTFPSLFGGTLVHDNVYLFKGNGPDRDANGVVTENNNGAYWYAIEGQDNNNPITQYRYLNPRYLGEWIQNTKISEYQNRYIIESLSDGTFIIYYRNEGGSDVRVLTCDANGVWGIKRYTNSAKDDYPPVSQATGADLKSLKLYLYHYEVLSAKKTIVFDGSTTFNVELGATEEQVLSYIQENIALEDDGRRNITIPCSGTTPKAGHYYLELVPAEGQTAFDSSKPGTYTYVVKYRNDDGREGKNNKEGTASTDTVIQTLTVNVTYPEYKLTGDTVYTVDEGTTEDAVKALINQGITVTNVSYNQEVFWSATPTAGRYWLKFGSSHDFEANGDHRYNVEVMVRQPDGTDLNVGSVTVNVRGLNLKFEGAQTYYVIEGTTEAALRDEIQKSSTVTELTNNLKVPYSASPIAGSYWLEFDAPFNSSDAGDHDYFVKVNYRMADGNDLTVKTLRIHVEDETVTSFEPPVTMAGIVPANVGPGAVVQDANGNPVTFKVNGSERFVTVGMLTNSKKNPVDTSKAGIHENLTLPTMAR